MKTFYSEAALATLQDQLDAETDPVKRERLENILREGQGHALTGDAHDREEGDATS
jgi:hypothetical protein